MLGGPVRDEVIIKPNVRAIAQAKRAAARAAARSSPGSPETKKAPPRPRTEDDVLSMVAEFEDNSDISDISENSEIGLSFTDEDTDDLPTNLDDLEADLDDLDEDFDEDDLE
jgi:hypothetical protein